MLACVVGGHRLEAEFPQPDRLGPGGEQGLPPGVEAQPTETLQGQLATEIRQLQQRDPRPGPFGPWVKVPRRGQTR